jgi:hypothetical protein
MKEQLFEIKNDSKGVYLFVKSAPVITLKSKMILLDSFKNNESLPRDLRIVDDAADSKLNFTISGVRQLIRKSNELSGIYDSIKYAVVLNNSLYVAYVIFAEAITTNSVFIVKAFSSVENARIWLEK